MNAVGNEVEAFWGPGELEQTVRCLGCDETRLVHRYGPIEDLLEHVPGDWSILECRDCGSLSLNPRPRPDSVAKAYAPGYLTHRPSDATHGSDNGTTIWWRLANGYLNGRYGCSRQPAARLGRWLVPMLVPLRQQLDYFYRHLPSQPGCLLDIGCGNGLFMLRAREAGWDVEGLEPDPMAAERAIAAGLRVHVGLPNSLGPDRCYDRVTLSHVLEHVHQPTSLLDDCFRLLKPGGQIWLSLPNIHGIGRRMYGRNWFALDPPRHLFLPTAPVLGRQLREAGFVDVLLRRRGRGAGTNIRMSEAYSVARGERGRWAHVWMSIIDVLSSVHVLAAEELVITARKPIC